MLGKINRRMLYVKLAGKKEVGKWKMEKEDGNLLSKTGQSTCSKYFYNKIYAFYFVIYIFQVIM